MHELGEWESFYLIVGGAAGALIGLQFVVLTLIANGPHAARRDAAAAFATPTIVHFCAALFLSAIIRVPWTNLSSLTIAIGVFGIAGTAYAIFVSWRMHTQKSYQPEFEDWLFHCILPITAYLILSVGAFFVSTQTHGALLAVGTAALLFLLIGIHNAWDAVTYHVFMPTESEADEESSGDELE